jgi:hypothetical protein
MTAWIDVDTSKQVGDVDHLEAFADADTAKHGRRARSGRHDVFAESKETVPASPYAAEALTIPEALLRTGAAHEPVVNTIRQLSSDGLPVSPAEHPSLHVAMLTDLGLIPPGTRPSTLSSMR